MLNVIKRIGIVCYGFCYITGAVSLLIGFMISISPASPPIYVIWYLFSAALFITGFFLKYIFFGHGR